MPRTHDMGGHEGAGPIDQSQHMLADWEVLADALGQTLGARGIRRTDESRRIGEDRSEAAYLTLKYYERWISSSEAILIEKGILTKDEIDSKVEQLEQRWGRP